MPLNDPVKPVVATTDPVTINPLGNPILPVKYDADVAAFAQLLVPTNEPLNEPVLICTELETMPVGLPVRVFQSAAPPPFIAYEAVNAYDAEVADAMLPLHDPVKPAVAIIEPVTVSPLAKLTPPEMYDAVTANDAKLEVVAYELETPDPPPFIA